MLSLQIVATSLVPEGQVPWLSLVTFAPLLGAFALMFVPKQQPQVHRNLALIMSILTFALSLGVLVNFDAGLPFADGAFTFQLQEGPLPWIEAMGVSYALGVDGFSLWLVVLTTFLMPIAILSTYSDVNTNVKEYMICLLFLETGMLGALVATDVFLFYIFWELMLIPMYLIIGVWGGEQRVLAAVKFFIYTMVGSLLMLIALLYVYFKLESQTGSYSFLFADLVNVQLTTTEQVWLCAAFLLAFAIKVPLFPFHTWLPLAHVQAPTAGSVILAGVLLKMGTYGMVRYAFPVFPDAVKIFAPYIATLCVIGIVYGAIVAMVQDNVKKLVAYSSVSHLGFCVLGLITMTPQGIAGGLYIMLAHGIATGGLFLCVGILYERRHTKMIEEFGGIAKSMPVFATMFMIIVMASVGLPGLNGFVGEFLALIGTSKSQFLFFDDPIIFTILGDGDNGLLTGPTKLKAIAFAFGIVLLGVGAGVIKTFTIYEKSPAFIAVAILGVLVLLGSAAALYAWYVFEPSGPHWGLGVASSLPMPTTRQAGPEMTAFLFAAIAASGVIFAAAYLLWMFRRVMFGPITNDKNRTLSDLNGRELAVMIPIVLMCIFMGVYPKFFLGRAEPSINQFLKYMQSNISSPNLIVVESTDSNWVPKGKMLDTKRAQGGDQ